MTAILGDFRTQSGAKMHSAARCTLQGWCGSFPGLNQGPSTSNQTDFQPVWLPFQCLRELRDEILYDCSVYVCARHHVYENICRAFRPSCVPLNMIVLVLFFSPQPYEPFLFSLREQCEHFYTDLSVKMKRNNSNLSESESLYLSVSLRWPTYIHRGKYHCSPGFRRGCHIAVGLGDSSK